MERDATLPTSDSRSLRVAPAAASRLALRTLAAQREHANAATLLGLTAFLSVGALAFANGGYFPVAQGWAALILLWLAAAALATRSRVFTSAPTAVFAAALAAVVAWTFASALWSASVTETFAEGQRLLVYLALALVALLLLERASELSIVTGVWAAIAVVATYGLATRLFPKQFSTFDSVAVYRLSSPVGYWNALGVLAALGTLLALGLAARARPSMRTLAAGSTVVTLTTMYFTFSRGSWIALGISVAAAVALDRRRLQLVSVALVTAPWGAGAIWFASRSDALTHLKASVAAAAADGHGVAVVVIGAACGAALTAVAFEAIEDRVTVSTRITRLYAVTLVAALVGALAVTFVHYGSPVRIARKAYRAFSNEKPPNAVNLNERLLNFSGNGRRDQWRVALHEGEGHVLLGSGAGTYDVYWFRDRHQQYTVHDAHNLYLETFAETGAVGLALLLAVLVAPLAAAWRARRRPLTAALVGAYVAYLVHAGVDWDWEMPVVTGAALLCGCALFAADAEGGRARLLRLPARAGGLALTAAVAAFVVVTLIGYSALSASSDAVAAGRYASAEREARHATSFLPWSSKPWQSLGEAQTAAGDYAAARRSFARAAAKDPSNWLLWLDLAQVSRGGASDAALRRATLLNPLSPEIVRWAEHVRKSPAHAR